jgi:hypothetical protein
MAGVKSSAKFSGVFAAPVYRVSALIARKAAPSSTNSGTKYSQ